MEVSGRCRRLFRGGLACVAITMFAVTADAQGDTVVVTQGDSVLIRLIDADLRGAVMALARFVDRPVLFGAVPGQRVTLETPRPVHRADVLRLLRGLIESQNLEFAEDTVAGVYRVGARSQPRGGPAGPGGPRPLQGGAIPELFVIRLRHARASDVAATVNALYGRADALGEIGVDRQTLPEELRQSAVPPAGVPPPQAVQGVAGRPATLSGDVTIVPDASTNSLLIRASRADFALLEAAVQALDVRPLQVLIEVLIVEARKDRCFALGLDA
jgi:general secretion pathway protein D